MSETKRLGRGLEALLGPVSREQAEASGALREVPTASVKPNPFQPRTRMDEGQLDELVASMQSSGLLQPVVVRPRNGGYELIAGERRWRAATRLGWTKIPAVVKDVDDQTLLTLALIENLQRDDLSPIDEAAGYLRLATDFQLPQVEIARLVAETAPRSPISCACSSSPRTSKRWCMSASCPRVMPARSSPWPSRTTWSRSHGGRRRKGGPSARWKRESGARVRRLPARRLRRCLAAPGRPAGP